MCPSDYLIHPGVWKRTVKRLFDVLGSGSAVIMLAPLVGGVAILVRTKIGRPIIFRQARPGWHGQVFTLCKFRTMTDDSDDDGEPLPDDERLTPVGSMLRRWSIDELPELWNVLKGDMSLVGPRPLLVDYLDLYTEEQMRRHEMRPGLTGLAQVSGRNAQSWEDRLALDVWYVDHWSLWLDARILAATVITVLTGEGTSAPGQVTMAKFEGSPDG